MAADDSIRLPLAAYVPPIVGRQGGPGMSDQEVSSGAPKRSASASAEGCRRPGMCSIRGGIRGGFRVQSGGRGQRCAGDDRRRGGPGELHRV